MKRITLISILTALSFLIACNAVKNPALLQQQNLQTNRNPDPEYRIQVGDQLDIKFFYNLDLNEQVTVRPDGRISLQLVHEIMAAGLTPAELADLLTQKYTPELKRPEITVIVRSFAAQRIYVDGEVTKAGLFPLTGFTTVLQAISQAGGMKETARRNQVVIIRRAEDDRPLVFQVDLEKVIDGTDISQDIALKPFDVVFVPRSVISNINVWVDQYIRKNLPITPTFGINWTP